jgi:hypothetical protein
MSLAEARRIWQTEVLISHMPMPVNPVFLDEINHPQAARGPEARASAG